MAIRENYSRKRVAILETLRATKVHPTAEWVYEKLKPEYTDLSLGTVYRNIKKFCSSGQVRSIGVIDGQEHFDGDTSPHCHFVCDKCGKVLDVKDDFFTDNMLASLSKEHSVKIVSADVMFNGTCNHCLEKQGKQ